MGIAQFVWWFVCGILCLFGIHGLIGHGFQWTRDIQLSGIGARVLGVVCLLAGVLLSPPVVTAVMENPNFWKAFQGKPSAKRAVSNYTSALEDATSLLASVQNHDSAVAALPQLEAKLAVVLRAQAALEDVFASDDEDTRMEGLGGLLASEKARLLFNLELLRFALPSDLPVDFVWRIRDFCRDYELQSRKLDHACKKAAEAAFEAATERLIARYGSEGVVTVALEGDLSLVNWDRFVTVAPEGDRRRPSRDQVIAAIQQTAGSQDVVAHRLSPKFVVGGVRDFMTFVNSLNISQYTYHNRPKRLVVLAGGPLGNGKSIVMPLEVARAQEEEAKRQGAERFGGGRSGDASSDSTGPVGGSPLPADIPSLPMPTLSMPESPASPNSPDSSPSGTSAASATTEVKTLAIPGMAPITPPPLPAPPEVVAMPKPGDADYYERLAKIMVTDDRHAREAADLLLQADPAKVPSAETRKLIAQNFKILAETEFGMDQQKAIRGLGKWGGKYSVPVLVGLLERFGSSVDREVLPLLGEYPDPRGADAVAPLLGERMRATAARECLRRMGSVAEDALIRAAPSENAYVCLTAIELLGECGGEKSLNVLRTAAFNSRNAEVKAAAKTAIRLVLDREGVTEDEPP